jgi:hypothetical protein
MSSVTLDELPAKVRRMPVAAQSPSTAYRYVVRSLRETAISAAAGKSSPPTSVLRWSAGFALEDILVMDCLLDTKANRSFALAWEHGFTSLPYPERRGALLGTMGHIAESAVETTLAELGWAPVWHFTGPGQHGVDLIMLAPTVDHLAAVEVKSTFRPHHVPSLTATHLRQMSQGWLDKADNPGMHEWGLTAEAVYGLVAVVNFSDRTLRYGATADFERLHPVRSVDEICDLRWLDDE